MNFSKLINRFTVSGTIFSVGAFAIVSNLTIIDPSMKFEPIQRPDYSQNYLKAEAALEIEQERIKQLSCLAYTGYGEARNQSELGQEIVMNVVMNRVESPKHPNTVCGVVSEPKQFSMYNEGDPNARKTHKAFIAKKHSPEVLTSIKLAVKVTAQKPKERILPTTVLNYHTTKVNPDWSPKMKTYTVVEDHKFLIN